MPEPKPLPELLSPTKRRRWQFGLWYLLLLMTVVAVVAGVMSWIPAIPWLFAGMLIYVLGFAAYLLLRLPWLIAILSPERDRVRENRRRLTEWAEQERDETRRK